MTLVGTGTPAHKHIEGGTIKYHNRPYQPKESAETSSSPARLFALIPFKL
jgi:hypothetical protein